MSFTSVGVEAFPLKLILYGVTIVKENLGSGRYNEADGMRYLANKVDTALPIGVRYRPWCYEAEQ